MPTRMTFDFTDRVALVTGAGTGIGAAVARALGGAGARVAVCGLEDDPLDTVAAEVRARGGDAVAVPMDVTDSQAVDRAVQVTVERFGGLDHAVNCAGVPPRLASMELVTPQEWRRVLEVNLDGVFHALQAELRAMLALRGGSIVNIASMHATRPTPGRGAYPTSKFGVVGLTKTAAIDMAGRGIRVNAVSPGVTDTPMVATDPAAAAQIAAAIPIGRMATPDEIANAVAFLLSDEAGYITGVDLVVDGGLVLR